MGRIGEISQSAYIPSKLSVLLKTFLRRARWPAAHFRRSWIRQRAAVRPARSVVSTEFLGFKKKITGLMKSVCLRRRFRLQTLFIAAPYPNTLIMHTCMISRLWDMDELHFH